MDYNKDMKIDETALDVELLNQPKLATKWGEYWARCQKKFTQAEENVKVVRSELVEEIFAKGGKPTGPIIEAYYRTHPRHIKAKKKWIKAQFELNMADVAKWQIGNTRKESLQELVKLHGQSYFSGPNVPRDLTNEAAKKRKQEKADSGVKNKMQRKSK